MNARCHAKWHGGWHVGWHRQAVLRLSVCLVAGIRCSTARSIARAACRIGVVATLCANGNYLVAASGEVVPDPVVLLARGRAQQAMEQQIADVRVGDGSLRTWLTQSPGRDRAFRVWVRSYPGLDPPCWFSNDVCAVRFEIAWVELATALGEWDRLWPLPDQAAHSAAQEAFNRLGSLVSIVAVGACGRPEAARALREIEERPALARQAAAALACRELLDQVRVLKLTATDRVSTYVDAEPRRGAHLLDAIRQTAAIEQGSIEGVAEEAIARLTIEQVVLMLARLDQAQAGPGEQLDLVPMVDLNAAAELMGVGVAPPPAFSERMPARTARLPWADRSLSAAGRSSAAGASEEELVDQARREAERELANQLYALPVAENSNVGGLAFVQPRVQEDLDRYLQVYQEMEVMEWCDDGSVELRVRLPLQRWAECVAQQVPGW